MTALTSLRFPLLLQHAVADRTGLEPRYAGRVWDDYVKMQVFPRDGGASDAAVQTLIEIVGMIRSLPRRTRTRAADCINWTYLKAARLSLGTPG